MSDSLIRIHSRPAAHRPSRRFALAVATALTISLAFAPTAGASVSPGSASFTLAPGGDATLPSAVSVTVPRLPAKADIEIAIDTTGSMTDAIDQAKTQATALVNGVRVAVPSAHFFIVDFKDSFDDPEYSVRAPVTNDATTIQAAIDSLGAFGGDDIPEAQNYVLAQAATDSPALWRVNSRKFVVLITDAPPHGAQVHGFPSCPDTSADPHGLDTDAVVADLAAAQRTLFAVTTSGDVSDCYSSIAAASYPGSVQAPLGTDLTSQLVSLIGAASASVDDVHLEVAGSNPSASWISFSPMAAGPLSTPATVSFSVGIHVPSDAPAGTKTFDLVALADGGDIGHLTLTVQVVLVLPVIVLDGDLTSLGGHIVPSELRNLRQILAKAVAAQDAHDDAGARAALHLFRDTLNAEELAKADSYAVSTLNARLLTYVPPVTGVSAAILQVRHLLESHALAQNTARTITERLIVAGALTGAPRAAALSSLRSYVAAQRAAKVGPAAKTALLIAVDALVAAD